MGQQGRHLAEVSKAAFVSATSFTFLVMAIVVGIFALVIPLFAPARMAASCGRSAG